MTLHVDVMVEVLRRSLTNEYLNRLVEHADVGTPISCGSSKLKSFTEHGEPGG